MKRIKTTGGWNQASHQNKRYFDKLTFEFKYNLTWKKAAELVQSLSDEQLGVLLDMSRLNTTKINNELAMLVGIMIIFPLTLLGLPDIWIVNFVDYIAAEILLLAGFMYIGYLVYILWIWTGKTRSMEISTFLDATLAFRKSGFAVTDAEVADNRESTV